MRYTIWLRNHMYKCHLMLRSSQPTSMLRECCVSLRRSGLQDYRKPVASTKHQHPNSTAKWRRFLKTKIHHFTHRRVIGKIDKETGEIIPTGKRGPKVKNQAPEEKPDEKEVIKDLRSRITERDKKIDMLTKRIAIIEDENQKLRDESGEIKALRKENKRLLDIVAKIREMTK